MKTLLLVLLAIVAIILTAWLVLIPAGVVAGSIKAFRHGEHGHWGHWKGLRHHGPH
ncbi:MULTISPECIES: hypothetical protein [Geomonas]|uniref:hypothetical protein n=1 Tax=Geomonas TaxID=2651583 RepID=UPI0018E0657C|nr:MULTISPECIES: hypothetical protein [Geomonas]